jgi:oxalate decarboxylase
VQILSGGFQIIVTEQYLDRASRCLLPISDSSTFKV